MNRIPQQLPTHTVPDSTPGAGRYAPSPSGDLHVGNLRTAVLAWLLAKRSGLDFVLRIEDLDRVREGAAERQLADLASLGLDWREPVLYQSTRLGAYQSAFESLKRNGLVYECYCTRREILEAATAPHSAPGAYPGTCRDLPESVRRERRKNRPPAWRLRSAVHKFTVADMFHGQYTGTVDDFVLLRNDGTFAYNLAVVIDDNFQGVSQVVRGDDLLSSAPRQAYLATLLGYEPPTYAHVPLVLNERGRRLAKRDGAVTLAQLREEGFGIEDVLAWIGASIPLEGVHKDFETVPEMLDFFNPEAMNIAPYTMRPPLNISSYETS